MGNATSVRVANRLESSGASAATRTNSTARMILDFRFAICDLAAQAPSLSLTSLSLTPRFSGVGNPPPNWNRSSGFKGAAQTAEAVQVTHHRRATLLMQGVNEIGTVDS